MSNVLRKLPSVNELLESPQLKRMVQRVNRNVVVLGVRTFLDNLRSEVQSTASEFHVPSPAELADRIAKWIAAEESPRLRPVINATGILLHTGLGRAPLAEDALRDIEETGRGYCSLEIDLASGERSQRMREVERLLQQLTGAEAAAVVNNNAAATLLALTALAHGREVVVSRGQLVEIGGSFRLPEVMTSAGAHLREVGTTNKTRLSDYQEAISAETAALMRVHSSNYRIVGFTEQVSLEDLVALGRRRRVPVIDDIGSGALLDLSKYGVEGEPIAADSIKAGADLVLFSGDKLLGGPQCGIIIGRKVHVDRITGHPMMRALRVDKTVLAALAATLRLYRDPAAAEQSVPLLSLLGTPLENLKLRASRLAPQMAAVEAIAEAEAIEDVAYLGGGSVPSQELATWCIALKPANGSVEKLAQSLRTGTPSLFGRIKQDRLLLDLRSVAPRYDTQVVAAVEALDRSEPRNDKDAGKTEGAPGESTSSAAEHIAAESTGS